MYLYRHRDVHGRRVGVVGALGFVDVIVWMDGILGTELTAENLYRAVGDNFVRVHVALGAGAGLPDDLNVKGDGTIKIVMRLCNVSYSLSPAGSVLRRAFRQ